MPLLKSVPTVRIDLPTEGEWVEVKARLSAGDRKRIEAASFRVQVTVQNNNQPDVSGGMEYEAAAFIGLEVGIVAWSFDEPITIENLRALDEESYDAIATAVNELWKPRTDDERKNSSANGAAPSEAAPVSLPSSAG